jgi:Domain of unknown function (DUF4397)
LELRLDLLGLGLLGFSLCLLSGCGGSSTTTGNLRFVQASPDAGAVTVYNERKLISANLSYGNNTTYFSFSSGSRLRVYQGSGSHVLFQATPAITSGSNETLILTGPIANPTSILLTDGGTSPATGDGEVRVANASRNIGTPNGRPDVYVISSGASIAGVTPTISGLAFNSSAGYNQIPEGSYEVVMTAPNTKNVLLDTGAISLTSGNQTVIALDRPAGGFTFALLTDQ